MLAAQAAAPQGAHALTPTSRAPLLACALAALVFLAYANSLHGAFVLDDYSDLLDNTRVRRAWPPMWLLGTSRPIVDATFALNYALGGLTPRGYHAVNIAIHALAALLLWWLLRRVLRAPAWAGRFDGVADSVAWTTALLWAVHPLQTESVTYVVQRAESLAGLWTLACLYALARSVDDGRRWAAVSMVASALAMATKPIAAIIPVLAVFTDWVMTGLPVRALLAQRRGIYLALASTWLILGACLWQGSVDYAGTAEFGVSGTPAWRYVLTQPEILGRYLRLTAWPAGQVFDYAWPLVASPWRAAAAASCLLLAMIAMTIGLRRRHPVAIALAWSMLALAPSSLVPMRDAAAEHRVYLALIGPIATAVGAIAGVLMRRAPAAWPRIGLVLTTLTAAALIAMTIARNSLYRQEGALWHDTLVKRPENPRAWGHVGIALAQAGALVDAGGCLREALRRDPLNADWHYNVGVLFARQERPKDAEVWFSQALALRPQDARLLRDVGIALARADQPAQATACLSEAVVRRPHDDRAHYALATVLREQGYWDTAWAHYLLAIYANPRHAAAHHDVGILMAKRGLIKQAFSHLERAVWLSPRDTMARANLELLRAGERSTTQASR